MCITINKNKSLLKFVVFIFIFLQIVCRNSNDKIDISKYEYVISQSDMDKNKSRLLFINGEGEIINTLNYKGSFITRINKLGDELFLHSERLNEHYKLKNGELERFSINEEKYKEMGMNYVPVWDAKISEDDLLEFPNVGIVNGEYLSSVVYSDNGERKEAPLKEIFYYGSVENKGKIYIAGLLEKEGKYGISIVDKKTQKTSEQIRFKNEFVAKDFDVIAYRDKIVVSGSNNGTQSGIGVLDVNTLDVKDFIFEDDMALLKYVCDDLIYVITNKGYLYKFDENLNIIERKILEDQSLQRYESDNNLIRSNFIVKDNFIYVMYKYVQNEDKDKIAFIQKFDKKDFKSLDKFDVKDNNKVGGITTFTVLGD